MTEVSAEIDKVPNLFSLEAEQIVLGSILDRMGVS